MTLRLNGSSAGSVSLDAPSDTSPSGTDVSFTLPTADGSNGQVIQTNGSGALSFTTISTDPDGAFRSTQQFTSSGTWTKPSGLKRVRVYVTGGGGGGAIADNSGTNTATGGSAGGTAIKVIEAASLGSTETVTIGAGGAKRSGSNGDGGSGGTSSFGSHCSATGGGGGTTQYVTSPGVGSSGDINLTGGSGHYGWQDNRSGQGGSSYYGTYGKGAGSNQAGIDGTFGGGGGGTTGSGGGSALNSGAGGAGFIYVEQYF